MALAAVSAAPAHRAAAVAAAPAVPVAAAVKMAVWANICPQLQDFKFS